MTAGILLMVFVEFLYPQLSPVGFVTGAGFASVGLVAFLFSVLSDEPMQR